MKHLASSSVQLPAVPIRHPRRALNMVRCHWHVEAGQSAFNPPGGNKLDKERAVRNVMVEMEVRGGRCEQ